MAKIVRGASDIDVDMVVEALSAHEAGHPEAVVEVYRRDPYSILARIIDPDFDGFDWVERHNLIWGLLENLPEDLLSQMSLLVLVTPDEMGDTGSSLEFDDPLS